MSRKVPGILCLAVTLCIGTLLAGTAQAASTAANPVAFVYVSSNYKANTARVYGFAAAPDGTLTPTPYSPYYHNVYTDAVNGKYLFGRGYYGTNDRNIYSFSIGPHGYLTQTAVTDVQKLTNGSSCAGPVALTLDHTGATLYSSISHIDCSNNGYFSLQIHQSTGALTYLSTTGIANSTGYRNPITFLGKNKLAYEIDRGDYNSLTGFQRESGGSLEEISIDFQNPNAPSDVGLTAVAGAADPTNHLAIAFDVAGPSGAPYAEVGSYTADVSNGNLSTASNYDNMPHIAVAGPRVNAEGVITAVGVLSIAMSPSGELVAVGGATGLQIFHFNGASPITYYTGALTTDEIDAVYWDNDDHLYAISKSSGKLFVFHITPTSVKQAPGSPHAVTAPVSLIVQPLGPSCSAPSSPGVRICSPTSGATANSPVQVRAASTVTGTISRMELWLDGAKKYTSAGDTLSTSVSLAAGKHRFAVLAVNTAGKVLEQAVYATVK
jgi:hypothetical protein